MATVLHVASGTAQGNHYFDHGVYLYAGFGSQRETDWFNDGRVIWVNDATSAEATQAQKNTRNVVTP